MRRLFFTVIILAGCLLPACRGSRVHAEDYPGTRSQKEAARQPAADAGLDSGLTDWDQLPRCEPRPTSAPTKREVRRTADAGPALLTRRDLQVAINGSMGGPIVSCYRHLRPQSADRQGRWVIRFVIAADGSVERAAVVDFRPVDARREGQTNPRFESCITAAFCAIRFPASAGRDPAYVSYPLHLDFAD